MARIVVLDHDPTKPRPTGKWRNEPTVVDGHHFDSKAEADEYAVLKVLARKGVITDLQVHPRFRFVIDGVHIGDYIADFSYRDATGALRVIDVKSPVSRTPVYKLKRRLMSAIFGVVVEEVNV